MSRNILSLPFDQAVRRAAFQNRKHDMRNGNVGVPFDVYLEEAEYILRTTGENWVPEFPWMSHIKVEKNSET